MERGPWVDQGIRISKTEPTSSQPISEDWWTVTLGQKTRPAPELRGSQPPFTPGSCRCEWHVATRGQTRHARVSDGSRDEIPAACSNHTDRSCATVCRVKCLPDKCPRREPLIRKPAAAAWRSSNPLRTWQPAATMRTNVGADTVQRDILDNVIGNRFRDHHAAQHMEFPICHVVYPGAQIKSCQLRARHPHIGVAMGIH
jgi:hypothetical protein